MKYLSFLTLNKSKSSSTVSQGTGTGLEGMAWKCIRGW